MFTFHLFVGLLAGVLSAQSAQVSRVGAVRFPTSCAPAAQPDLERGLALLHSFQYEEAAEAFDEAAAHDEHCAMCHWGKAMTRFHPLWGEWPAADAFAAARGDLTRARRAGAPTRREQTYISAAAAFFDGDKRSRRDRLNAFARGFERLHRDFPDDGEATALYALSLLTLSADGVDDLPNRRRATRLLETLFRQQPEHPGAAHYLVHATDHPSLAREGLDAARVYSKIAPDSSHALHMPAHTFVRLGLWEEVIAANLQAAESGKQAALAHRGDYTYQIHAMEFLSYAYLQRGLETKAREQVEELAHVPGASESEKQSDAALFAARTALELHRWGEAATLVVPDLDPTWLADAHWARTIGAARMRDVKRARENRELYRASVRALNDGRSEGARVPPAFQVAQLEADGWIAHAEGRRDDALRLLRKAVRVEERQVGESLVVPAREMLADLLLETRRYAQSLREYQTVLKAAPNRFAALLGAGRAAVAISQPTLAAAYFQQIATSVAPDADRPELSEVKAFLASR